MISEVQSDDLFVRLTSIDTLCGATSSAIAHWGSQFSL